MGQFPLHLIIAYFFVKNNKTAKHLDFITPFLYMRCFSNERHAVLSANWLFIFIGAYKPVVSTLLILTYSIFEVGLILDFFHLGFCPF